jgi:serine/threonine protein kinase
MQTQAGRIRGQDLAKRKRYEDVMLLAPGEEVPGHTARYRIEHVVGQGAYGAVYAAHDPQTPGRQVALKEFFPARTPQGQPSLHALWERERTVGQQASPHPLMPTFFEAFQSDGHFYIAQEFIAGATLDEIIARRHPLPRDWTLKWSVSLCDALAFLHSRQIVHHDLKPANIRITPQGHLVLLDFGAAQYFGQGHESKGPVELYGTEGYLPPELEADGQWIADVRTDIFALGCVLFEMIAGVAPDQEQINARSMYVTNSLIQMPNADLGLVKLINRAISYNTEYRYATAGDFLQELREVAPPVLLVSRKHLRFGEVARARPAAPQTVTLYNAGGGDISGEIKARAPWIVLPQQRFAGNHTEISVTVDPARAPERGKQMVGRLDISSDVQHTPDGTEVTGDKWQVECSMTAIPAPGQLQVGDGPGSITPITLSARRGEAASATLALRNVGEMPVDFGVEAGAELVPGDARGGLTAAPAEGTVAPGRAVSVAVSVSTTGLTPGAYQSGLTIKTPGRSPLTVPVTLRVLSPLGYLRSRLGGR